MKFNYGFALTMALIVIFSVTAVAAGENMTQDLSLDESLDVDDKNLIDEDLNENIVSHDFSNQKTSSNEDEIDLSINISVKDKFEGREYNRLGFEIPWTITAKVNRGTAHSTKVSEKLSDNLEYVSHNVTIGEFNPVTGIWDIGDLTSFDNATLVILTKVKVEGRFYNTVNATTESNDIDLSNNLFTLPTKSGTSKFGSNVTETSDDKAGAAHVGHYASSSNGLFNVERQKKTSSTKTTSSSNKATNRKSSGKKSDSEGSSNSENGYNLKTPSNSVSKSSDSLDVLKPVSAVEDEEVLEKSSKHFDSIPAYDYTRIPLFLFAIFLIILFVLVGYDRIKS